MKYGQQGKMYKPKGRDPNPAWRDLFRVAKIC